MAAFLFIAGEIIRALSLLSPLLRELVLFGMAGAAEETRRRLWLLRRELAVELVESRFLWEGNHDRVRGFVADSFDSSSCPLIALIVLV